MSGGGGQTEVVTGSSAPWDAQQPFLKQIFNAAQGLYGQGQPIVGMSPQTQGGLDATQGIAGQILQQGGVGQPGNPTFSRIAGNGNTYDQYLQGTARGDYLGSNPYLDQIMGTAADRAGEAFREIVTPEIDTTFAAAGRRGAGQGKSLAFDQATRSLSRSLSDTAGQIYGGAYESERGRMTNAASAGGALANQTSGLQMQAAGALNDAELQRMASQMQAAGAITDVGRAREGQAQYEAMAPWEQLARYAGLVSGNYGAATSQTSPLYSNPAASGLGGALGGAQVGNSIFPGGWGAGIGAGLGGLLGMFE